VLPQVVWATINKYWLPCLRGFVVVSLNTELKVCRMLLRKEVAFWNLLMSLKIVTKWWQIRKTELNNFLTNNIDLFKKTLPRHALSKLLICYAISWNLNFTVNLVMSFSHQKLLNLKDKKHTCFGNTKFCHPANFELNQSSS